MTSEDLWHGTTILAVRKNNKVVKPKPAKEARGSPDEESLPEDDGMEKPVQKASRLSVGMQVVVLVSFLYFIMILTAARIEDDIAEEEESPEELLSDQVMDKDKSRDQEEDMVLPYPDDSADENFAFIMKLDHHNRTDLAILAIQNLSLWFAFTFYSILFDLLFRLSKRLQFLYSKSMAKEGAPAGPQGGSNLTPCQQVLAGQLPSFFPLLSSVTFYFRHNKSASNSSSQFCKCHGLCS